MTSLQEVGGYVPMSNISIVDVNHQQLAKLASIDRKLDTLNRTAKEHHAETKHGNRTSGHAF